MKAKRAAKAEKRKADQAETLTDKDAEVEADQTGESKKDSSSLADAAEKTPSVTSSEKTSKEGQTVEGPTEAEQTGRGRRDEATQPEPGKTADSTSAEAKASETGAQSTADSPHEQKEEPKEHPKHKTDESPKTHLVDHAVQVPDDDEADHHRFGRRHPLPYRPRPFVARRPPPLPPLHMRDRFASPINSSLIGANSDYDDGGGPEDFSDSGPDSISSVSDITDREVEYHLDIDKRKRTSFRGLPPPPSTPPSDDLSFRGKDEFEKDPWNAVAVVGLRVYYQVAEGDGDSGVVKLRVERPNPYAESEKTDEEGSEVEKEKDKEMEAKTEMVLDVDDSAKDATLEGAKLAKNDHGGEEAVDSKPS